MPITNVAELLRCESTTAVLRLCGAKKDRIEENSADYAYFCALCHAIPMLVGHPLSDRFFRLFASMNIPLTTDAIDPARLWVESALFLSAHDASDLTYCQMPETASASISFATNESARYAVADSSKWVKTNASDWTDWEKELNEKWEEKCLQADLILFRLSVEAIQPSLYHVNTALATHMPSTMLSAQLLRYLCITCKTHNKTLLVQVEPHSAKNMLFQLQHLNKTLGLPNLILSVATNVDFTVLLPFASQPQDTSVVLGMEYTPDTSATSFSNIAAQYPIGRFFLYQEHHEKIKAFSITPQ